jgi:hypothetical protein
MDPLYVVTDIEADGPIPGDNSMLSFASTAITHEGQEVATFEAVLAPLEDARPDPDTIAWFKTQPEAYAAATANPAPSAEVISKFVAWILTLPGKPIFAAHPIAFDGLWIDYYLRRFANRRLVQGPRDKNPLFHASGICIRTVASVQLGWPIWDCRPDCYPPEWLGNHHHSHRAIDDARGYGVLLSKLLGNTINSPPS